MSGIDVYRGPERIDPAGELRTVPAARVPDRLDLRSILSIFRRRFKLFLYTVIICIEAAALFTVWQPSRYTATADVVIKTPDQSVTPSATPTPTGQPDSAADVDTEIEVLTSRSLADTVVSYLKLDADPDMRSLLTGGILRQVGRAVGLVLPVPTNLSPEDRAKLHELVIDQVVNSLDVERLSTAYALSVAYTDTNPVRAAAIANAFAHLYSQEQISQKEAQNRDAVRVLGDRIEALRQRAQTDFAALQGYRIRNNLLSTTGSTLTEQEISSYNQALSAARADAAGDAAHLATARAQLTKGSSGDDIGEALDSPVVHALRTQQATLAAKVADYSGRYGPKNPDLLEALRELAEVQTQIQAEINRTVSNLDAKVRVSSQRVASLDGSLGAAKGKLAQNNRAMVGLDDLQRRADTSQALYESYLNRYKEAVAAMGAERADSRMVSDARIPNSPSYPRPFLILGLGLLLGVGLGTALALIAEMTFSGLTTGEEVEERLGLPYLGGVPELSTSEPDATDPLLSLRSKPRSAFAEAFRGTLAALRQGEGRNQVIVVSSPLPNEGKTTFSACLAEAAVLSGKRAIVIDCDTARAQFSKRYASGHADQPGLREVLAGVVTLDAGIRTAPGSSVAILPITSTTTDDGLPIDREKMEILIDALRKRYDLIILDTAPVLAVAETRELSLLADQVVLVSRWRETSGKAISSALRLLPPAVRQITGVVLTRIDMKKQVHFGYGDPGFFYREYRSYYGA